MNSRTTRIFASLLVLLLFSTMYAAAAEGGHAPASIRSRDPSIQVPPAHLEAGSEPKADTSSPFANPALTTYGNASFVLPGYATLSSYLNVFGAVSIETNGVQVPIVSWTADGVFYVNVSDDLVFYNFATSNVTLISVWTPLYEDLMNYNGVANSEYITQDGSEIYAIGCPSDCQGSPQPDVEIEVANVSTGDVWTYSVAGLTYSTTLGWNETQENVEALLIGLNGTDNEAVIVDDTGYMYGIPIGSASSTSPTLLYHLDFFEANNLDWMPTLNSLVNEQAGGAITDLWQQLEWNGSSLRQVAEGAWNVGIKSAFADAGGYNITAGQWSFTAGNCSAEKVANGYLPVTNGRLGSFQGVLEASGVGSCQYSPPQLPLNAGGNLGVEGGSSDRVPITASGPFVAEVWNNTSAILNPVSGEWSTLGPGANPGIYGPSATFSTANLFHNGSYLVSPRSGSCEITCTLKGQAGATAPGTEWWLWNSALSEFPYPKASPLEETSAPAAPSLTTSSSNATTISVSWQENLSSGPLLNYTVCWGLSPGPCTHWVPLMPWATSFTLAGLQRNTALTFSVWALNYHYFGKVGSVSG